MERLLYSPVTCHMKVDSVSICCDRCKTGKELDTIARLTHTQPRDRRLCLRLLLPPFLHLYINTLRENLFSPLRSQIIVVFYDHLHVHCTSSPSSISSISQHFSSPTDEFGDFLFENGNRRRSKCIGDQSTRSSSTRHQCLHA